MHTLLRSHIYVLVMFLTFLLLISRRPTH